jgi:hypothetical protein
MEKAGGLPAVTGAAFLEALPKNLAVECNLRGPAVDPKELLDDDAVVSDEPENHAGGIHAITRGLKVKWIRKTDPAYERALKTTAK